MPPWSLLGLRAEASANSWSGTLGKVPKPVLICEPGLPCILPTVRVRDQRRRARGSQPTRGTPPPPALLCLVQSDKQGIWGHREVGSPPGCRMCSLEHPNSPGPQVSH